MEPGHKTARRGHTPARRRVSRVVPAAVLALASVALAAFLLGCSADVSSVQTTITPQASPVSSAVSPSPSEGLPSVEHIAVIVMENKAASQILGNPDAPFINDFAVRYSLAAGYSAITHPSLPNYLALTSGSTHGIDDDRKPVGNSVDVPNIADRIEASGRTWKLYGEGMPQPGAARDAGDYATKHIPFLYYNDILGNEARRKAHLVPFTELAADLGSADTAPHYMFIVPDLVNDMHDGSIAQGDAWLSREVPAILRSPAFTQAPSLLVLTWDEGGDDNHVVTVFAGNAAKTGHRSSRPYDHYSLLHTIEGLWGLPPLSEDDAGAALMGEFLRK